MVTKSALLLVLWKLLPKVFTMVRAWSIEFLKICNFLLVLLIDRLNLNFPVSLKKKSVDCGFSPILNKWKVSFLLCF